MGAETEMTVLTGKVRYRNNWFNQLVVQVEEKVEVDDEHSFHPRYYNRWRDARVTDVVIDVNDVNLIAKV